MSSFVSNKLILAITASVLFAASLNAQSSDSYKCDSELSHGFNASGSANATMLGETVWTFSRYVDFRQNGSQGAIVEPITVKTTCVAPSLPSPTTSHSI